MSCDISLGRLEPCKDSVGGIRAIYFINYTSGLLDTATFDSDEIITGFASALTLYKYLEKMELAFLHKQEQLFLRSKTRLLESK